MRRRRLHLYTMLICLLIAAAAWFIQDHYRLRTPEEELCHSVIAQAIDGIRSREGCVLIEFSGAPTLADPAVRGRVFNAVSPGFLHLVDIYPKKLEGSFRDPVSGAHADELSIKIEEWRSPSEAVVSILMTHGPLAGGGGTFLMIKSGSKWEVKETLATIRI